MYMFIHIYTHTHIFLYTINYTFTGGVLLYYNILKIQKLFRGLLGRRKHLELYLKRQKIMVNISYVSMYIYVYIYIYMYIYINIFIYI
jgi:hypothetical protein